MQFLSYAVDGKTELYLKLRFWHLGSWEDGAGKEIFFDDFAEYYLREYFDISSTLIGRNKMIFTITDLAVKTHCLLLQ